MLRKSIKLFLPVLACIGLSSCYPCSNLDCAGNNLDGQFRILSTSGNRDLVFGPDATYNKNDIRFFRLSGTDTSYYTTELFYLPGTGYDSIIYCHFYPKSDTVYMELRPGEIDTLALKFESFGSKCCGTITNIVNFRFNNSTDIPGNQGTQVIRK